VIMRSSYSSKGSPMPNSILLIDDDASFRQVIKFNLTQLGFKVVEAEDGYTGLDLFKSGDFRLVITDLKMPRLNGMEVLQQIKQHTPEAIVIVMTAFGDVQTAVKAMKGGAFDFIPKPFDREQLILTINRAAEHVKLIRKVSNLEERLINEKWQLIYASKAMDKLVTLADKISTSDVTVLISGESGTGKELLARRIHHKSNRYNKNFIPINCGAIPRELLESELFGHKKGAFTGAIAHRKGKFLSADGGTIFLDEVGELPLDMQVKLLRILQEQTFHPVGSEESIQVDVRIIAASNKNLAEEVKAGNFREDLFYRLNIMPLNLLPLRQRNEDLEILAHHFLKKYDGDKKLSRDLLKALRQYSWPGNVRELENMVQRLILLSDEKELGAELFRAQLEPITGSSKIQLPPEGASLEELEKEIIIQALEMNEFNQSRAARFLQIPRHVLLYRMEKFEIKPDLKAEKKLGVESE